MPTLTQKAYDELRQKGYSDEEIREKAKARGFAIEATIGQAPGPLKTAGYGLASGLLDVGGGLAKTVINNPLTNPLGTIDRVTENIPFANIPKASPDFIQNAESGVDQATNWVRSQFGPVDSGSGAYMTGKVAGQALPYAVAGPAGARAAQPLVNRLISVLESQNVPGAVIKYITQNALSGAISDATIAQIIGQNPLVEGAFGGVGNAAMGAVNRAGWSHVIDTATTNSAMDDAISAVGKKAEDPTELASGVSFGSTYPPRDPTMVSASAGESIVDAWKRLGEAHTAATKMRLSAAAETNSEGIRELHNTLKQSGEMSKYAAQTVAANESAQRSVGNQLIASIGDGSYRTFRSVGQILDDVRGTFVKQYDATRGDVAEAMGLDDEVLMGVPISEKGARTWLKAWENIKREYKYENIPEFDNLQKISEDLNAFFSPQGGAAGDWTMTGPNVSYGPQAPRPPAVTFGQVENKLRTLLDPNIYKNPNALRSRKAGDVKDIRGALNDMLADTIKEMSTPENAKRFKQARRTLAEELTEFEQKAFSAIRDEVRDMDPEKLVDYLVKTPGKVSELHSYLSKVEGSDVAARNFMGAAVLHNALKKATVEGGFNSDVYVKEINRLLQSSMQGPSAADLLFDERKLRELEDFRVVMADLDTPGGSPLSDTRGISNQARTEFAETLAGAAEQQQQTSALVSRGGLTEKLLAYGMSKAQKFFKLAAIDKIGMSNQAQSYLLYDDHTRPILIQAMKSYRDKLARNPNMVPDDLSSAQLQKAGVQLKTWLGRHYPVVFRKTFGTKTPYSSRGAVLGVAGVPVSNALEDMQSGNMPKAQY